MKRECRSNPGIELRQDLGEPLKIRGYAAIFDQLSEPLWNFRERIKPGAFLKSLRNDVRATLGHDDTKILGRTKNGTLTIREDDHGLFVEIIPSNTTAGRDAIENIKRGDLDQMSFSFQVPDGGDIWNDEIIEGKRMKIRELREIDLSEVSVVAFPAYTQTSVSVRSLWPEGMPEEIEKAKEQAARPPVAIKESSARRKHVEDLENQITRGGA